MKISEAIGKRTKLIPFNSYRRDLFKRKLGLMHVTSAFDDMTKHLYVGHCPFHEQRLEEPDFWVDDRNGRFICHSCKEEGAKEDFYKRVKLQMVVDNG